MDSNRYEKYAKNLDEIISISWKLIYSNYYSISVCGNFHFHNGKPRQKRQRRSLAQVRKREHIAVGARSSHTVKKEAMGVENTKNAERELQGILYIPQLV